MALNEIKVGPQVVSDGTTNTARAGRSGELIAGDLHARRYEANYRGSLFTFGIASTALVAANAIATGVTSTAQPVIGVWNPSTSPVNLIVLSALVNITVVANTMVNPAGFAWVVSTGQAAITTGSVPFNCKTLAQSGSFAKAFAVSTALTGMTGSLTTMREAAIGTVNAAGNATAVSLAQGPIEELTEGGIIVPPGGVLAIMNSLSTTTVNVGTGITWEEVLI